MNGYLAMFCSFSLPREYIFDYLVLFVRGVGSLSPSGDIIEKLGSDIVAFDHIFIHIISL